jgi:hypothetical protein
MRLQWVAVLALLSACGDDDPGTTPFPLTGAPFQADFDLANGLDQCTADGTLQFAESGAQLTGTLNGTRRCNGEDTDLSGPITSGALDGTHFNFTAETEPADCTFTGEESRDGSNEELRGTVECHYGEATYTGLFVAFRQLGT